MIINKETVVKEFGRLLLNLGQIIFTAIIVGAIFSNESSTNLMVALGVMTLLCLAGIIFVRTASNLGYTQNLFY